jgi:hypothetical protein
LRPGGRMSPSAAAMRLGFLLIFTHAILSVIWGYADANKSRPYVCIVKSRLNPCHSSAPPFAAIGDNRPPDFDYLCPGRADVLIRRSMWLGFLPISTHANLLVIWAYADAGATSHAPTFVSSKVA